VRALASPFRPLTGVCACACDSTGMYVIVCKMAPDKFRDIDAAVRSYQVPCALPGPGLFLMPLQMTGEAHVRVCRAAVDLAASPKPDARG